MPQKRGTRSEAALKRRADRAADRAAAAAEAAPGAGDSSSGHQVLLVAAKAAPVARLCSPSRRDRRPFSEAGAAPASSRHSAAETSSRSASRSVYLPEAARERARLRATRNPSLRAPRSPSRPRSPTPARRSRTRSPAPRPRTRSPTPCSRTRPPAPRHRSRASAAAAGSETDSSYTYVWVSSDEAEEFDRKEAARKLEKQSKFQEAVRRSLRSVGVKTHRLEKTKKKTEATKSRRHGRHR